MIYVMISLTALMGVVSLGVDLGRVHLVKTEMERCADATALGTMNLYMNSGLSTANYYAPLIAAANPVDNNTPSPTVTFTWGTWNSGTSTFTAGGGNSAVRVVVSKTSANNNAVPLIWGKLIGKTSQNLTVTSVAISVGGGASGNVSVPATSNAYLAGMPSGTTTIWGDTVSNASPHNVTTISVTPGTWISLTSVSGTTSIVPGTTGYFGANGDPSRPLRHGENYDGTPYVSGPENGIADAKMPADAMYGVFLTSSAPDATAAPPGQVDWTSAAVSDQAGYDSIDLKEPFCIGDGKTSAGTVKRFLVPPGATRLFLGVWDGVCNSNNAGTLTGTMAVDQTAKLVK